jgi:hypothetical protein
MKSIGWIRCAGCLLAPALVVLAPPPASASSLTRDRDPVVMTGAELPGLLGVAPGDVVAFRREAGGWQQVPVQVDERKVVSFGQIYNDPPASTVLVEVYADAGTYTGADGDPLLDADDEVVWMARDAGPRAPAATPLPGGVLVGSGVEVELTDSLTGGQGWIYLFERSGTLDPSAGTDYVTYHFNLLAGSYPDDYDLLSGPNPEDTTVSTALYATHFSDRWIRDAISIFAGGANGADILDRHRNLFGPGVCVRSEDTFSAGEGAFVANIDGPVRAIRSYLGANSGPATQRLHRFYEGRHDVTTFLRVHSIPGVMDLYDYSDPELGLTYANSLNPTAVPVNGAPDVVTPGVPAWELVTGLPGTLVIVPSVETDITPFDPTSYYEDDATPFYPQCTGDAFEYGQSGLWIDSEIPNTDPHLPPFNSLLAKRTIYYDPPGRTAADAAVRASQALTPLLVSASPFAPIPVPALPPAAHWLAAAALAGCGIRRRRPDGTARGHGVRAGAGSSRRSR